MQKYNHKKIERKWQLRWESDNIWQLSGRANGKKKKYILDMFPYPSAAGLHVGHPEGYTASDIVARYFRTRGYQVLHPMGFDSFGLPAENYAIKTGAHPAVTTEKNIKNMRRQIKSLGFSYDWSREIITSDPQYYKWTQWIFLKLFESGLAYEAEAPINWCPSCKTGLANEEVMGGKCERCGTQVARKKIKQWLVKITDNRYIGRLERGLDKLDWPESIKSLQKNWIGRSEGTSVYFKIKNSSRRVEVFTTRPDTLFGTTYLVLSPEHKLVREITTGSRHRAVQDYLKKAAKKSDLERTDLAKEKTGVFTGAYAVNPVNNKEIPIWIADYVLSSYGTGAIMAVPAHDERDFEFAKKYKLPIIKVVRGAISSSAQVPGSDNDSTCYIGDGTAINSGEFDGLKTREFKEKITDWLQKNGLGRRAINYRLRDWIFSRQRYWGEPIPIVHCQNCAKKYKQTFLLVHGLNGSADENWFPWFKAELEKLGHRVIVPNLPNAAAPRLDEWLLELKKYKKLLAGGNVVVIGHSLGAPAAVKFIEQENLNIKKLFLVAPAGRTLDAARLNKIGFSKKQINSIKEIAGADIDWRKLKKLIKHRFIYLSDNDPYIPLEVKSDFKPLSARIKVFKNKGHFNSRAGVFELPEILEDIHPVPVGLVPVPEKDLPLKLPKVKKYEPTGTGESPLAAISKWVNTKCPKCGASAKRETNTMPQWAGSNWYFLRYLDPKNRRRLAAPKKIKKWMPVDLYVGGAEHAVLHLIYARFIYKFLYDIGTVPKKCGDEPFVKLKNQGIILGEDGQKMSKSRGNVINPDEVVREYGADTLRLYEMFMGPFEDMKPWNTRGIIGIKRFLDRVWLAINMLIDLKNKGLVVRVNGRSKAIHRTVKKVTDDIENFKFNTAISEMMKFINEKDFYYEKKDKRGKVKIFVDMEAVEKFIKLLAPFAPHIAEELWERLGHRSSLAYGKWPSYDKKKIFKTEINIAVQINGKLRDNIKIPTDANEGQIRELALASPRVKRYVSGKPKKIIFVKGRLINFVI